MKGIRARARVKGPRPKRKKKITRLGHSIGCGGAPRRTNRFKDGELAHQPRVGVQSLLDGPIKKPARNVTKEKRQGVTLWPDER